MPYENEIITPKSQPRIKKPFLIKRVCLKPETPNDKTINSGIVHIKKIRMKLKSKLENLINEKIVIKDKHIKNAIMNILMLSL